MVKLSNSFNDARSSPLSSKEACFYCEKLYKKFYMHKHVKKEHSDQVQLSKPDSIYPYACRCGQKFTKASSLCRHKQNRCRSVALYKTMNDVLEKDYTQLDQLEKKIPPILLNIDVRDMKFWGELKRWQIKRARELFSVIIMDPPWRRTGIKLPYNELSNKDIMSIPIRKLVKTGVLFLWVTNSQLQTGLDLMKQHGFRQKEDICWQKIKTNGEELKRIGMWLLHSHENCLVGFKGKEKDLNELIKKRVIGNTINEKPRETSQKPQKLYEMIDQWIPGGYRLEIFGRSHNARNGYITIGNQLN